MESFSKKDALVAGWDLFLERPLFLMGVALLVTLVSIAADLILQSIQAGGGALLVGFNIVVFILNTLLSMGMMLIMLRTHDRVPSTFLDLIEPIHLFWKYALVTVLSACAFIIGLLFFVVPGIIAQLAFSMALYIVIDKEVGVFAALAESYRITRGHRLNLFLFAFLLVGINMLGALFFGIGLLFTIPLSLLSLVWVYRYLQNPKTEHTVVLGIRSWVLAGVGFLLGVLLVAGALWATITNDSSSARDAALALTLAQTKQALETYHSLQGVYPDTLEVLVPEYLFEVPVESVSEDATLSYVALDTGVDFELCAMFEDQSIGLVCEYASVTPTFETEEAFDFSE